MESLHAIQAQLFEAISKLGTNIKKDSADRKTSDYFKRRLETLEAYWADYQYNHDRLLTEESKTHPYFIERVYEQAEELYRSTKALINQQCQDMLTKLKMKSGPSTSGQEQRSRQQEDQDQDSTYQEARRPASSEQGGLAGRRSPQFPLRSVGSSSKLDDMQKRQASNFRAFQRTVAGIKLDVLSEKWELEDALQTLQARWSVIDTLHWELDSELEGSNDEYERSYTKQESLFNELKKAINSKMWSVAHKEKYTPKMDIPIFAGSYQNWTSFKDLFTEAIHNNKSMPNAQKMQFLKGKLRGEAERLIQHLQISSENYLVCWDILNNRYNNTRLIFTAHVNTLLNLPVSQTPSVNHIKKIHDTTSECINAIKNLGVNVECWDPLIVHILLQKLDTESHTHYLESLKKPRDLPTLHDFLTFLESRFTTLESSRKKQEVSKSSSNSNQYNSSSYLKHKSNNNYYKHSFTTNKVSASPSNSKSAFHKSCPLCKESHGLYFCPKFLNMSPQIKRQTITKLRVCQNCLWQHDNKGCLSDKRCRQCNANHNTVLHEAFSKPSCNLAVDDVLTNEPECNVSQQNTDITEILLSTAMIKVQSRDGLYHTFRALIDPGSQVSIISEKVAQILALPRKQCKGVVSGIGVKESTCKGVMNITCCSVHNQFTFNAAVLIMNTLIKDLPTQTFSKPSWAHLDGIQLADPEFYASRPVDILLGADVYSYIIMDGISRGGESLPIAQQTRLGWILSGQVKTLQCNVVLNQVDELRRFWEIEDIAEASSLSSEDQYCMDYYKRTTTRRADGSYVVRLPFQENFEKHLGSSKPKAIAQFRQLERKFHNNKSIAEQYKLFIKEYELLGHMKPSIPNGNVEYYLPHHCVIKGESTTTRLRVVFNASAKTSTGYSLNDVMLSGPNLQQDLQALLIRWRQYRIAFTADIEKMFRFIYVHENDQKFQKIIWRDSPEQLPKEYQLCTVTYGTKAAPFLAMRTLKQLAEDERQSYSSEAIKALENSFYMDDILHGCHFVESALSLKQELIQLLKSGAFNLRKWSSNTSELLQDELGMEINQDNFDFKHTVSTKTLGLRWNPTSDMFTFQSKIEPSNKPPTKRSMLSDISKLFDPLGWLSPLSTSLKLMFQRVWTSKIQWDDQLPADISKDWINMRNNMHKINQFTLKRWLGSSECSQMELHGFSDASQNAYSCVIYCKQVVNGDVQISLVAGKTRLVPVNKSISLPRIELSGALLLSKLMLKVQQCLHNHTIKTYGWTDSMVVLAWLQGDPGRWKPFVSNRVREITEVLPPNSWRYVKSAENPADCASRGITVEQLMGHSLWWAGPSWLPTYNTENYQEKFSTQEEQKQLKQANAAIQSSHASIVGDLLTRYSSFTKLTRVLAWILRFIKRLKYKQNNKQGYLTLQEIKCAECVIIKYVQQLEFTQEVECLQNKLPIPTKSKLLPLNPYIDEVGLLRVGGRLSKASISQDMKHPIIIPHEGHLTTLIIDCAHLLTFHGGARVTAATIRLKYWIIGGYRAVKKRIRTCITCRKHNPSKMTQLMGDLPPQRCNVAKPFYHTGVDYTGHVFIKANKGRGIKTTKGYISVFVCMVTKLIHLELVSDLTSSAFLAALRRMAARKGAPRHLYSGNGTNFIGANKILQEEFTQIQKTFDQDFMDEITNMKIQWHFNAPSFPSGGGLWESAVKSVKFHLRRVIGEQRLTFEEYSTVLAQVEAVLNSRPLCPLTEDPNDLELITPSSFININQDMSLLETETDMRTRWHMTQKIVQDVWKRWRLEYLSQLSARSKWRSPQESIKINDVVTIQDANLPPGKWAMGRVVQLHPGADGHVRVVTLKTKSGLIKRPILKLSVLPVNDRLNNQESQQSQPINNTQRPQRSSKRSCYSLMSLAMLFLSFMSILSTVHCNYNVTILKDNQGLYFDKVSNMQLIRDEWKIVTYYDMNPYWHGNAASSKYIDYLKQLCNKLTDVSHCDTIQIQLQQEYSELEYYNHVLLSQHSSTRPARRQRRGLIDGVGYLANSLFGVLDERFADQYKQDIQLIQRNENHLLALMKNQTSVIEAEYNVLKRNEISINKQHKILNMLSMKLENLENSMKNESLRMEIMSDFSLAAIATSNLLRHLKTIQNTLLNTITDVYHGRLNFQLLSPEQLKETLNTISSHLPKDLSLPVNNMQENFRNIYYLLKTKARMSREYLIFELTLPLVTRDSYEIMKIMPIPQVIENKFMATIVPIADHVAINLRQDSYITMSIHDVESCLVDSTATYLCHTRNPVYHLTSDDKLCERDYNTGRCKVTITSCSNQWTEINRSNKYLFFCCNQCYIRVLCENQVSAARLEKAGILSVEHGCIIKTDNFTVHSHSRYSSNINVKDQLVVPDMEPLNHVINAGMPITQMQNDSTSNSKELEDIKKQLRHLKENENMSQQVSFHDIHHYVAFYVAVGAAIVIGAVFVARRIQVKRASRQALARDAVASFQVAAQASVAAVAVEAGTSGSSSYPSSDQTLSEVQCNQSEKCVKPKVFVDKCTTPIPRKTKFN